MKSEALAKIKTARQINTSLDIARSRRIRTTNSLSKAEEAIGHPESFVDRQLEQILAKERARFAAVDAAANKSRQRLLKTRERLAISINRNRALTELRQELQRIRWGEKDSQPTKTLKPHPGQNLHRLELKY